MLVIAFHSCDTSEYILTPSITEGLLLPIRKLFLVGYLSGDSWIFISLFLY